MKMNLAILWTLSIVLLANADSITKEKLAGDSGRYMILVPTYFKPGEVNHVSVTMFNTEGDTQITMEVFKRNETYFTVTNTFSPDTSELVEVALPDDLDEYNVMVRITGNGSVEFSASTSVGIYKGHYRYRPESPQIIQAQTDKSIYKSFDMVRLRTFGLSKNLTTLKEPMNVILYDPNENILEKWNNEMSNTGVISLSFQLSSRPLLGMWHFRIHQGDVKSNVYFEVREFKLPKFEVNIDATSILPDFSMGYLYLYNDTIEVNVTAKYTFGKPVVGLLELNISLGHRKDLKISKVMNISGSVHMDIPFRNLLESDTPIDVPQYGSFCSVPDISINAKVTETLTQKTLKASEAKVRIKNAPIRISMPTRPYIKHGLPSYSEVQVKRVDDKPLTENDRLHPLTIKFSDDITKEFEIPADGKVYVDIELPKEPMRNIRMEMIYKGNYKNREYILKSTEYPTEYRAVNNTNIEAMIPEKYYKVGDNVQIAVNTTHPLTSAVLTVLKARKIILNKFINVNDEMMFDLEFMATEDMIPEVDVLITGISSEGSFVADGAKIPVTVVLKNTVTGNFSKSEGRAGDQIQLDVHTHPFSTVFAMTIDKSIELLKGHDYITEEDILTVIGGKPGTVKKVNSYDPSGLLRNYNLNMITNFPGLESTVRYPFVARTFHAPPGMSVKTSGIMSEVSPKPKLKIRMFFPETLIWEEKTANESGIVTFNTKIPDSITRWVANAFSVSPTVGVGVMKTPAEFYSFQPFFINLDYPHSVIRNESFPLKVSVFNYLKTDEQVNVTVLQQDGSSFMKGNTSKIVNVKSNEQELVSFDLTPQEVGDIRLNVRAESDNAADEIHKFVLVKPEGVTKYFNKAFMFNLTGEETVLMDVQGPFDETVPNLVPDSTLFEVSVIGDIMGQVIDRASSLVRMPSGCGEQNMINFSPNIYIYHYLEESNRLAADLKKKLIDYTKSGYKNQLSYQHKDGSYSAFGENDSRGSTWLTAFVMKSFSEAKKNMQDVYIDDMVLEKGIQWLIKHQSERGNFVESGRVLHKDMQGGASEGKAMTAYVLIALLEYRDLIASDKNQSLMQNITESAIKSAVLYLNNVQGDIYSKAISLYAMALMEDDEMFGQLQTELEDMSTTEGDFKHWSTFKLIHSLFEEDKLVEQPNIEMSAYVLLAYAKRKEIEKGFPILRWLISQRSSLGGYDSTQSTVIALQALAEFASLINSCCDQNITIDVVDNTGFTYTFPVLNFNTSTILYKRLLPSDTTSISLKGTGKGFALVQVAWQYNILKDEEKKSNIQSEIDVNCVNDKKFHLHICNNWLLNETSGMGLIEVNLPSGFNIDVQKYERLVNVKRIETDDSKVNIYLDEMPKERFCLTLEAEKWHEVNNRKVPQAVISSLFYDSSERVVETYEVDCSTE